MARRSKPHAERPTGSRVGISANIPREVDAALREIHRHTRLSISEQVSRALVRYLEDAPPSIEDESVLEPRLLRIQLEEKALVTSAKLKIAEGRRILKRVEGWKKAQERAQQDRAVSSGTTTQESPTTTSR
jgi:hypothetical protein